MCSFIYGGLNPFRKLGKWSIVIGTADPLQGPEGERERERERERESTAQFIHELLYKDKAKCTLTR